MNFERKKRYRQHILPFSLFQFILFQTYVENTSGTTNWKIRKKAVEFILWNQIKITNRFEQLYWRIWLHTTQINSNISLNLISQNIFCAYCVIIYFYLKLNIRLVLFIYVLWIKQWNVQWHKTEHMFYISLCLSTRQPITTSHFT